MRHLLGTTLILLLLGGAVSAADPEAIFCDTFDAKPAEGWKWLRENPPAWRMKDGALEIRVEPGVAGTVKNALVRPAPDRSQGTFAIDLTVTNTTHPTNQYEQAGITWYHDGQPVFKLVKELIDGDLYIIPGKVPMKAETVQLRLVVTADTWTAQFRPNGEGDFQTAATGKLPPPGSDEVSIQCYQGPPDAEHWIRFDDFRILKLSGEAAFVPLFDGKSLAGWHTLPGGAWEVKDGMIVGTSPKSEPKHGLLVTDKTYRDFTVRAKFKVVTGNSGFYFRSEKVEGAVGVHGFQAEVANEPSVAGLYETGGRAWVAQPDPEVIKKVYKPGDWNDLVVTAVGRHITVTLNGQQTVDLPNDEPSRAEGHIALQLHGGQDMEVMFKDIAIQEK